METVLALLMFCVSMVLLNEMLMEIKSWRCEDLSCKTYLRRIARHRLFWLYVVTGCLFVFLGMFVSPLGRSKGLQTFFAIFLVISVLFSVGDLLLVRSE
jgi:hypothetical protein